MQCQLLKRSQNRINKSDSYQRRYWALSQALPCLILKDRANYHQSINPKTGIICPIAQKASGDKLINTQIVKREVLRSLGQWLIDDRASLPIYILLNFILLDSYIISLTNKFIYSPNQALLCLIGRYAGCKPTYGSLIGNNIRDARNWSRRISRSKSYRRMRFYKNNHLKTDLNGCYSHWRRTTLSDVKKKREGMCVCVCEK